MRNFLFLVFILICVSASAQKEVTAGNIRDHVGDSVKYCGKVVSARVMEKMSAAPAFLNIDGAYPNQVFTVVIWKDDRLKFMNKPELYYTDKKVCVYGRLDTYREQLQVVVRSEAQLVVQE